MDSNSQPVELRAKTSKRSLFLLFLGALCLLGIYGQSALMRTYLLDDFQALEETQVRSSLNLVNLWLDRFLHPLEALAEDATTWPETDSLLATGSAGDLGAQIARARGSTPFDVAAVLDMRGQLLFATSFEAQTGAQVGVEPELLALFRRHIDAYQSTGATRQSGWTARGGALVASASVAVAYNGSPRAILLLGRRFPETELLALGELGAARVQLVDLGAPGLAPSVRDAFRAGAARGEFASGGVDDALQLCQQMTPALNATTQLLCVQLRNSIYLRGRASAEDLRLATMVGFVLMIFGAWLFLDRALLRRLAVLTQQLVAAREDSTEPLEESLLDDSRRRDELGLLTGGMARLLGRVRRVEHTLREQEQNFRTLSESTGVAIFVQSGTVRYANPFAGQLTGYTLDELRGMRVSDLVHADDRGAVEERLVLQAGDPTDRFESVQGVHKDGESYWARLHATPIRYEGALATLVTLYDVSQQRYLEHRLSQQGERQRVILESIQEGIVSLDANGHVDFLNPTAERLIGCRQADAIGRRVAEVVYLTEPESHKPLKLPLHQSLVAGERNAPLLAHVSTPAGETRMVEVRVSRLRSSDASHPGNMLVLRDVSELRKMAQHLEHQAAHDELTGLINRREFSRRLTEAMEHSRRTGKPDALCYIDLDQFKIVNDTCGHHAGDLMLRQIGAALSQRVRSGDTLARLGGDEFGLLLVDCPPDRAMAVANGLRQAISEIRFNWAGRVFSVDASIGIAMLNEVEGGIDEALATADAACFVAKDTGRNRVRLHRAGDSDLEEQFGQMRWAQRLKDALEKGRLQLYRQSIHPLSGDAARAYEILLRLHEADGTVIPAGEFLGAAERYQMMFAIDSFVVTRVLAHLRGERAAGREPPQLFVNLSGLSLGDDSFRTFLSSSLDREPELAQYLTFEVTETAVISNLSRAKRLMEVLQEKGCSFALDDFGTGMSSFAYLKEMDVQYLKVAGPFVRGMCRNDLDRSIVKTFATLAHSMNVRTIAEEVEDEETLKALRKLNIDYAQGFYLERPRPLLSDVSATKPAERAG